MATAETVFADNIKSLGDSIVKLTVLEAKSLGDYLETVHGIKAAAAAVVAGPAVAAEAAPAAEAQTEFEVILDAFGAKKLEVIKVVRAIGPRPRRRQGTGRSRSEERQGRHSQGRSREDQERSGRSWRYRQDQVTYVWPTYASKCSGMANRFRFAILRVIFVSI